MYKYVVVRAQMVSSRTVLLTLKPQRARDRIAFKAGQYAAIAFRRSGRPTTTRCFSILSGPGDGLIQFGIRISGDFTITSAHLEPGQVVTIRGPFGSFTLDQAKKPDIVFFAGGIGITPFLSILRAEAAEPSGRRITLVYSNNSQNDVPFADELREQVKKNPNVSVVYAITNGDAAKLAGEKVVRGQLTPAVLDRMIGGNFKQFSYFICGPDKFKNALTTALLRRHVPATLIQVEDFGLGGRWWSSIWSPVSRRVYAGTAATIGLAALAVMVIDLKGTAQRIAYAQSLKTSVATPAAQAQATPVPTPTPTPTDDTPSNATSAPASTPTPVATPQPTPVQQQTYQSPVSSQS